MKRALILGAVPLVLALSSACVTKGSFQKDYAKATCGYFEECMAAYFNQVYDSKGECVDEWMDSYGDDYYDDCDFDRGAAQDCLDAVKKITRSCDPYDDDVDYEACYEVYDC